MDLYFTLLITFLPVLPLGLAALIIILTTKGEKRTESLSRLKWGLACFIAAFAFMYYFDDSAVLFECDKETMRCDSFRSTMADPELRFVKSYDFTKWTGIELKSFQRRSGRYLTRTAYKIVLRSGETSEEFPKRFDIKEWAEEEIGKLNRFLTTKKKRYVYRYGNGKAQAVFSRGIRYSLRIMLPVWILWILYDRKKKPREM